MQMTNILLDGKKERKKGTLVGKFLNMEKGT